MLIGGLGCLRCFAQRAWWNSARVRLRYTLFWSRRITQIYILCPARLRRSILHFHCRKLVFARAAPLPRNPHLGLSSGGSVELHSIAVDADCGGRTNTESTIPTVVLLPERTQRRGMLGTSCPPAILPVDTSLYDPTP